MVKAKNKKQAKRKGEKQQAIIRLLLLLGIIVVANIIASNVYTRIDLTSEKRYSISKPTKQFLKQLDDVVYVEVYLEGNNLPSGFRRLQNATRDLLKEFKAYGGNRIQFTFVDPLESSDPEIKQAKYDQLIQAGLQPTNLQVQEDDGYSEKVIFPGALVNYKGKYIPVQILENKIGFNPQDALNSSIIALEYKFANAINRIMQVKTPRIAFIQGHGEHTPMEIADLAGTLQTLLYEVAMYDISNYRIDPDIDVAIIAGPTSKFSEKDKYKIDQYIMHGGRVLWLVDAMNASLDSLNNDQAMHFATGRDLGLDDMLFKYGVRLNNDLIQDVIMCNPILVGSGDPAAGLPPQTFPWYYYPLLTPTDNHPIGRNLGPIESRFTGTIDTVKAPGIKKTPILTTSPNTKVLLSPVRVHFGMLIDEPDPVDFKQGTQITGVLLEGQFQTNFKKERLAPSFLQAIDTSDALSHLEISEPNKMIVISDADVIRNDVGQDGYPYPLGYYRATNETFANKSFMMNAIEYLLDDSGLLETRNKEIKVRLFDQSTWNENKGLYQLANIGIPVSIIIIFGLLFNFIRKRKYAS